MSPIEIAIVVGIAVLIVILAIGGWHFWRRQSLREQFGPEYERLASQEGRATAERKLRQRQRRHSKLQLRPLDEASRQRYSAAWTDLQSRFVDAPDETIGAADELVARLVEERGYPTEDYDEQVAHLSVEHARTLQHYRSAHEIYLRHEQGEATTEQLRQALVHYRALFADLLGESPVGHEGDHPARSGRGERATHR